MEDGHNDSEVGPASLHRPEAETRANGNGRSPTKSTSTSEEEGQFDEEDRSVVPSASPARPSSPREKVAKDSNATSKDTHPHATWRQRTPTQSDRPGSYSRRQDVAEPAYASSAGRVRGLEGSEAEAGPSRRPFYRQEERAQHPEPHGRYRDLLPSHDRYEAASRSVSIGSYDDRYHSPSAAHYDDRARDWNRERERAARDRDHHWDRARDPVWTGRPQYGRQTSPARPSPHPHSRGMSGSWSGPTSPTASAWRERWSSGAGAAGSAWERERDRDRLERDRERAEYWQGREGPEFASRPHQRRVSNPRSPSFKDGREQFRPNASTAYYGRNIQSKSSPTPSLGRSSDLQRTNSDKTRRDSLPKSTRALPDRQRSISAEGVSRYPPRVKHEDEIKDTVLDKPPIQDISIAQTAALEESSEDRSTNLALAPVPFTPLEAINEEVSSSSVPPIPPQEVSAIITNAVVEQRLPSSTVSEAPIPLLEPVAQEEMKEVIDAVVAAESIEKQEHAQDTTVKFIEKATSPIVDVEVAREVRLPEVLPEAARAEIVIAENGALESDVEMVSKEQQEGIRTIEDIDMLADEQYDASNDVTVDSIDVGDDSDLYYRPRLQLDDRRLLNTSDDPPLPTPRTREEQDRLKRASMHRLLQGHKVDALEVRKVFTDNKKILAMKELKPLESAIYGEYPRRNHTEPWLDEDDEEIKSMRLKMTRMMQARQKRLNEKVASLKNKYKQLNKDWQRHCAQLYRQSEARESQNSRTLFGGTVTISGTSASLISQGSGPGQGQGSGAAPSEEPSMLGTSRANRRHTQTGFAGFGDAVRSEAEFLEILASLENADMQDPNMRAARTTATEPDMMINPDSKAALLDDYDDDNGFVADPLAFYFPTFDPDYWTEEETATFERRYALFPKQFGKIAASLPHKTAKQCVSYYYLTKHDGHDYKSLTAARNRDRKRKSRVKPKKGRGSALMADLKGGDDMEEDDQQSPVEGYTADSSSLISARARPANASSRARILTSSTLSGDLGIVAEEGEDDSFDIPNGRKRRVDEMESDDKKSRPSMKSKRAKSEKKSRGAAVITPGEEGTPSLTHGDPDLAAAEALGALAGLGSGEVIASGETFLGRKKKTSRVTLTGNPPSRIEGIEDGIKRSRQTTSSYWSVAERNEFLRSLAIWGKDWDAIATTLSTKSAAQARNYYARNVEESEFVEAMTLARENASMDIEKRQEIATAFIQRRASMAIEKSQQMGAPQSGYFAASATPTPDGTTPTARGLNINSLLNEDMASNAKGENRASLNEWFGKEGKDEDSNDDTEDEELEQAGDNDAAPQRQDREQSDYFDGRGRSSHYEAGYPTAVLPSRHMMNQVHRRSPSILSSMPPPSAFIGTSRYHLSGQQRLSSGGQEGGQRSPLSSFHYVDSMSRGSSHSPMENHPSQRLGSYEREAGRSSWSSTPTEPMPLQHRHGSWPHVYSPTHLAPPQTSQSARDDRSSSSLSPFPPRPSTTHGSASFPFAHPMYDRPHSSGHISSVRSLSPNPPTPRLPTLNQSLFSQRRDQSRDSSQ